MSLSLTLPRAADLSSKLIEDDEESFCRSRSAPTLLESAKAINTSGILAAEFSEEEKEFRVFLIFDFLFGLHPCVASLFSEQVERSPNDA